MIDNIVNIINFVRNNGNDSEREKLWLTTKHQVIWLKKYHLPSTSLLQYDALIDRRFTDFLKQQLDSQDEVGIWLEVVRPLAEKAGIAWRGRDGRTWDHHSHVGFCIGYPPQVREKLVDECMEEFRNIFGHYPKSVGSWHLDAHTLGYLEARYAITTSCICKDQWGTDGYTLWGGYYNQAYYPSINNAFTPAQTEETQIGIPVFRMLGNDPIYQYDEDIVFAGNPGCYSREYLGEVMTLEPTSPCGKDPAWVEWYIDNFKDNNLSFGYSQVGQENSMGWEGMKDGYTGQMQLIAEKLKRGEIRVETLRQTGKWFREKYKLTPVSCMAAMSDWRKLNHRSIWYYSRFYRVNILEKTPGWKRQSQASDCISNGGWRRESICWIRDLQLFNDRYPERYLHDTCKTRNCIYDNLPVCDGANWSSGNTRAGIYPVVSPEGSEFKTIIPGSEFAD